MLRTISLDYGISKMTKYLILNGNLINNSIIFRKSIINFLNDHNCPNDRLSMEDCNLIKALLVGGIGVNIPIYIYMYIFIYIYIGIYFNDHRDAMQSSRNISPPKHHSAN